VAARGARAADDSPDWFLISGGADSFAIFVEAFNRECVITAWPRGRDYVLDLRYADGDYRRFQTLAAEVIQRWPVAIVVTSPRLFPPANSPSDWMGA